MGEAMLRAAQAGRGRGDRRRADRACPPLSSRAAGSGSSGSAARGCRPTRSSRRPGAPRSAAGIAWRRRTSTRSTGSRSRSLPSRSVPDGLGGGRLVGLPGGARAAPGRVSRRARAAPALDRRRRHARQGNDRGDDRVRAARERRRPGLADRRARPAAREQCGRGGGLARRRGRRVRPHGLLAPGRDRGRDERRPRPPQRVRSLGELEAEFDRWAATAPARRPGRAAVRRDARAAGRAQPPERGRRPGGARARRCRRARTPPRRSAGSPAPAAGSRSRRSAT